MEMSAITATTPAPKAAVESGRLPRTRLDDAVSARQSLANR
jgi:hypothetical protein